MKKLLILFAILLVAGSVFASTADTERFLDVVNMLEKGRMKSLQVVKKDVFALDNTERYLLYNFNKKDAFAPFMVNSMVGFGIGSYSQSDNLGGTIGLVGDLIGYTLISVGMLTYNTTGPNPENNYTASSNSTSDICLLSGAVCLSASRVFQMIRPFTYTSKYNKKLKEALFENTSVSVVPYTENGKELGVAMVGSVKF